MRSGSFNSEVSSQRQHGLDVIRAAAIASVLLYHAKTMSLMPGPAPWPVSFGWMGVDLFFVLSGFLIASQLLKPLASGSRPNYCQFFVRRALRTLPALALVLLLYFAFPKLRETPHIQPFWQFPTFTENLLFKPDSPKAFDQFWSLCVEEQFYVIFPLVLVLVSIRPTAKRVVTLLAVILAFGIAVRSLSWLEHSGTGTAASREVDWRAYVTLIYYPTWSRLDGLLAGVAIATLRIFRPDTWRRFVARPNLLLGLGFAGIFAAILLWGTLPPLLSIAFGFPIVSASVALLVAAASTGRGLAGTARIPGAQALATGAYSIYLSHKIAFHAAQAWIAPAFGLTGYASFALAIVVAIVAGALLYWSVERPFLKLRDSWRIKSGNPARLEFVELRA